jgi:GT2 family glycosyltransferase
VISGVSIIIPTYRRDTPLRSTLADLGRVKRGLGEVLIVDQNPEACISAGPFELENGLAVRVLRQPPGVVAARNHAASVAAHEVLLFLDDDVRIEDVNFLEQHRCNYDDPAIDAVCGQELSGPDFQAEEPDHSQFASVFEEAEFFNRRASERRLVAHLSTCNCSVRRSSFQKIGGFDPLFTGNSYGDDTDLAIRMANAGMRIVFDPLASLRHLHWREGGLRLNDRTNRSSDFDRHLSSWLVYYRHVPPPWRRWFLWHRILRRQLLLRRNVFLWHQWPAIIDGILEARSAARRMLARDCPTSVPGA